MVVRTDPAALDELAPSWDALVPPADRLGPFPLSIWSRLWWSHFGAGGELRVGTVVQGEELVAVVPLHLEPGGPLLFTGGRDVTDYTIPAGAASVMAAAADLALELAAAERCPLHCVSAPDDHPFVGALATAADRAGVPLESAPSEPAPYIDLPAHLDDYFGMLDGKERHELRRKLRRFERELGPASIRRSTAATLDADLELFFGWHRQAPGDKAGFMDAPREAFFRELAGEFLERGWLALDILTGGDTPVAAGFSFVLGDTVYLYNSSLDPGAVRSSPGMVLLERLVDRSIADGLARLDFLKGSERYKFQLGGVARPLSSITVGRVGPWS